MGAGESARARGALHRAHATRLESEAADRQRRATEQRFLADRWEAGVAGEEAVAQVLEAMLADGWRVLNDRRRATGSPANIDHIAIGAAGVVVVDAKNWSGAVTVGPDGCLRQNGFRRSDEVADVAADARRISLELLGLVPVRSALCFVGAADLPGPLQTNEGPVLVRLEQLRTWLRSLPDAGASPLALAGELNLLHPPRSVPPAPPRRVGPPPRVSSPPRSTAARSQASVARRASRRSRRPVRVGPVEPLLRGLVVFAVVAVVAMTVMPRLVTAVSDRVTATAIRAAAVQSGLTGADLASFCARITTTSTLTATIVRAAPGAQPGTCAVRTRAGAIGVVREGVGAASLLGSGAAAGRTVRASCGLGWYEPAYQSSAASAVTWATEKLGAPVAACLRTTSAQDAPQLVHVARDALA